jgi:general secretion pathway protein B
MSFILDALKKSEAERQQSNSTEFVAVPGNPSKPSIPRWLLVLGFLLAINFSVLIGLLLRDDNAPEQDVAAPVIVDAIAERSNATTFQDQVAAARMSPPAESSIQTTSEPLAAIAGNDSPHLQADLISQNPSSVRENQLYPSIQEMRVNGNINIPNLHLDIHVFSEMPTDRFVFINMTKLREGSRMSEGPAVLEITPDGVILRHLGKTFLMPRE